MLHAVRDLPTISPLPEVHPPEPGSLLIRLVPGGAVLTLVVVGEAEPGTAHQLRAALIAGAARAEHRRLVIDLHGLAFCDLSGTDALRAGLAAVRATGVEWIMQGVPAQLRWLLATFPEARTGTVAGAGSDL